MKRIKNQKGQCIVEMVVGTILLIPVILFMLDVGFAFVCTQVLDDLARDAARGAASQKSAKAAVKSAKNMLSRFRTSTLITNVSLADYGVAYPAKDTVIVRVRMDVNLPVPFPFINNSPKFLTEAVQPVLTTSDS